MNVISNFRYPDGTHTPLSNFSLHPITLDNVTWPTSEHYYQAMKTLDLADREWVRSAPTPGSAKRRGGRKGENGRTITLRHDWEAVKYGVMRDALEAKFELGQPLGDWLLQTLPALLVEGNTWHDRVWGVCTCERCGNTGDNWLGVLLLARRAELRARLP